MYLKITDHVSDKIDKKSISDLNKITKKININININNHNKPLLSILDSQLIFQNDNQLQNDSFNKICMGFVYFKNSYSIKLLFNGLKSHILTQYRSYLDDQRSLNFMLRNYSIYKINRVTFANDKDLNNKNILDRFWEKYLLIEKYNVSDKAQTIGIALLSMNSFVRYEK